MKSWQAGRNNKQQKYKTKATVAFMLMNACAATSLRSFGGVSQMQQEIISLNDFNENKYNHQASRFSELRQNPYELVQLNQDDLDDNDIAAFSMDMEVKADDYKTLGQQKLDKEEAEKQRKEGIKKAAEEKVKKEKLKKEEEAKKKKAAEAAKKKKIQVDKRAAEEREKREKEINEQLKMEAKQIPDDPQVMKAYSLAIAQSAENSEPESPIQYATPALPPAEGEQVQEEQSYGYDTKKQDEENTLSGIMNAFTKSKDSASFGGLSGILNLAQTSKPNSKPMDSQFVQIGEFEQEGEGESEMESMLDDAISVAEVETGEPSAQNMVATQDVSTVTDESQVSPIEIDASGDTGPSFAQRQHQMQQAAEQAKEQESEDRPQQKEQEPPAPKSMDAESPQAEAQASAQNEALAQAQAQAAQLSDQPAMEVTPAIQAAAQDTSSALSGAANVIASAQAIGSSDPSVLEEKRHFAELQATMDQQLAAVDAKRDAQDKAAQNQGDDPESQLKGLMTAQSSLKRMTSAFASKPNADKIKDLAQKLGVEFTPEIMQLGDNTAISNALVEIAVSNGKSEAEITAALGPDE